MKSTISVEDIPDPQNPANTYMLIVLNDFDDYVYSKKVSQLLVEQYTTVISVSLILITRRYFTKVFQCEMYS